MKNKIWPYTIILAFVLFGAYIIQFVVKASRGNINLVSKDYYKKELAFQDRIENEKNTLSLGTNFSVNQTSTDLTVNFPESFSKIEGDIELYKPEDPSLDFITPLNMKYGKSMNIPTKSLKKGKWILKVRFKNNGKGFYHQQDILVK